MCRLYPSLGGGYLPLRLERGIPRVRAFNHQIVEEAIFGNHYILSGHLSDLYRGVGDDGVQDHFGFSILQLDL